MENKKNITKDGRFSKDYQPPEKWTLEKSLQLADELIEWLNEVDDDGEDKGNIFYEEFLIIKKNLYEDLISYLCGKFVPFSERIKKAKKIQQLKLIKYGVGDRLNASMTKFVLNVNHGMVETSRSENENVNKNYDMIMKPEDFIENVKKVEEEVAKKKK